ncbi:porin [Photobacterium sanctipauli]|uniref:Porin n=1 Tax=Photobacterium sanctipauli TaxID=1342794 RepID=A0A2T3NUI9_9GAMM|nr:porin [Photobacterium sanctipauli]PSW19911.1 porin [Photobacterium sanctipauli]
MKNKLIFTLPLLVTPLTSLAAISITDNLSVSGFGSTSITRSDNSVPIFVHREITDDTCYDCDTTFGLQADLAMTDEFHASVQLVKRPQDTWSDPELEWAYLSYEYDDLTFKGGRLRIPLFLVSEYYYVGQAYTWARPPQEVYDSILGFTYFDGVSATWRHDLSDEAVLSLTPYYGFERDNKTELGDSKLTFDTEHMAGISAEVSGFNYRVHFGYMNTKYSIKPSTNEEILNIYTLGGEYSLDDWQFMAEVQADSIQTNWYVSGAYRMDKFTPYLVYGESHHRRKSNSVTAGLRYDLTYSISLNAEWQGVYMSQSDYDAFNTGQYVTPPRIAGEDKDTNIYTLMLNFVF